MIDVAMLWAGGIIVGSICGSVLPKWWNGVMVVFRQTVKTKAAQYLKDPATRAWVAQGVALAQKQASKKANVNKLRLAGKWLKARIPGPLDDQIIDAMIELVVIEIKKPIEL